jgi:hypothetical protein
LAPLFRPFFSPVDGVPDAADLWFKPLKSHGFVLLLRTLAAAKEFFPLLSGLKQGERTLSCRREAMEIAIVRRAG